MVDAKKPLFVVFDLGPNEPASTSASDTTGERSNILNDMIA